MPEMQEQFPAAQKGILVPLKGFDFVCFFIGIKWLWPLMADP